MTASPAVVSTSYGSAVRLMKTQRLMRTLSSPSPSPSNECLRARVQCLAGRTPQRETFPRTYSERQTLTGFRIKRAVERSNHPLEDWLFISREFISRSWGKSTNEVAQCVARASSVRGSGVYSITCYSVKTLAAGTSRDCPSLLFALF